MAGLAGLAACLRALFTLVLVAAHLISPSLTSARTKSNFFTDFHYSNHDRFSHYATFPESERLEMLEQSRKMFTLGYDCYMKCAFPADELDPVRCKGRGPDKSNPGNININDVLGGYSLTLVDSLDTLAVMGNVSEFQRAVKLVVDHVNFDQANTVQLFEANIRVLGSLISAHMLMEDEERHFGDIKPSWYKGELLVLAKDLADRFLPAFMTNSGFPHPRINLMHGVPENGIKESCTAGIGSLILEFGMLSRILEEPVYEGYARRAISALWERRNNDTGLLGFAMDVTSGKWLSSFSGIGAGMDSFYEYLLKSHILFRSDEDLAMFNEAYANIKRHQRRGRVHCNRGAGSHPIYVNVDMKSGETANNWIDALQAAFPGVQVLHGDLEEAICHHALYYTIWKRYGCLPERYNWKLDAPDVKFYPLRPELMESTYMLYQATKNPFYLHVGREIIHSLNTHTRTTCGYATIHDVGDKSLEDRQESFFLSETCKYLFLLFDVDNPVNKHAERYLFTTEGHVFPIREKYQNKASAPKPSGDNVNLKNAFKRPKNESEESSCQKGPDPYELPLKEPYLAQIFDDFGVAGF